MLISENFNRPVSVAPRRILPIIVLAQFAGTSVWFAGNGVLAGLTAAYTLPPTAVGALSAAVQGGFICGTLLFAIGSIADRYSPSRVFFWCAWLAGASNVLLVWPGNTYPTLLSERFLTGLALAGIYPVGMKIAADYYDKGLGKSLGFLVGALVLGTAFPHLLRELWPAAAWREVLFVVSGCAVAGGLAMRLGVPDGPYRRARAHFDGRALFRVFGAPKFRAAAFGYFGHMWELYAFWVFVPVLLQAYLVQHPAVSFSVPLWAFLIIAAGGVGCVVGGYVAQVWGARNTAAVALAGSGSCCLLVPVVIFAPPQIFLAFLLVWGTLVVANSPLFSTLVARHAPAESRATALTIVNCIGFATTVGSIFLLGALFPQWASYAYWVLAIGPVLGLAGPRSRRLLGFLLSRSDNRRPAK